MEGFLPWGCGSKRGRRAVSAAIQLGGPATPREVPIQPAWGRHASTGGSETQRRVAPRVRSGRQRTLGPRAFRAAFILPRSRLPFFLLVGAPPLRPPPLSSRFRLSLIGLGGGGGRHRPLSPTRGRFRRWQRCRRGPAGPQHSSALGRRLTEGSAWPGAGRRIHGE